MKKVLLLAMIATALFAEVTVKGFTLGVKIDTAGLAVEEGVWYKESTLGGIAGVMAAKTTDNGTVARVFFIPDERLNSTEVNKLTAGIEKAYGIDIVWDAVDSYSDDIQYSVTKGGVDYFSNLKHNQFYDAPYKGSFLWEHKATQAVYMAEEQARADEDF